MRSSNEPGPSVSSSDRMDVDVPQGIYKLDADCFDHIFGFLKLDDLHAIGQTCKAMQNVAGEYFRANFKSTYKCIRKDKIFAMLSELCVSDTTTFIRHVNYLNLCNKNMNTVRYIDLHSDEFESLTGLCFNDFKINGAVIQPMQKVLRNIESLELYRCRIEGDFYEVMLKYCDKIKEIHIKDDVGKIIKPKKNVWMLYKYPSLQMFGITQLTLSKREIRELTAFLGINSSIHTFSTTSRLIWENADAFMRSCVSLETLEVRHDSKRPIYMPAICELLNQLHTCGIFKRLTFNISKLDGNNHDAVFSLSVLDSLAVVYITRDSGLEQFVKLKKLELWNNEDAIDLTPIAKNLENLRYLAISQACYNDILPFVRHSPKLRRFKTDFNERVVDLMKLNAEREQLFGACKLILYVSEKNFLAMKRQTTYNRGTDLNMIEIRRESAIE